MANPAASAAETHVLAIASHVTSGYVGNTMATFCMQALGCEVSAIHTVNYSSHVGYGRFKGRKSTSAEVADLYAGLKDAGLDAFDMMLTGYCPSAELVDEVGRIARDAKLRAATRPGSFFWVLDPVMGDNGRLYVAEDTVPAYRNLLRDADLILPNQFEAELLSEVKISDWATIREAIAKLHHTHQVPHVLITSIQFPLAAGDPSETSRIAEKLPSSISIIGSTSTSDFKPRLFRITVPAWPIYFSGTGDMFAALTVARLRQAAEEADVLNVSSWRSPDDVEGPSLPLAKAAEKVLASMHAVLRDTANHYNSVVETMEVAENERLNDGVGEAARKDRETQRHLKLTRAAEVRVVRNMEALKHPPDTAMFKAQPVQIE